MFQQRLRPLEHLERRVVAVRYSMNEPVVETAEFPAAAARAAILVYLEDNLRRVVVVVRSSERRRLVQYEMRDEEFHHATGAAFDAALTFAESMGFLLDDEKLANTTGEARARGLAPLKRLLDARTPLRAPRPGTSQTPDGRDARPEPSAPGAEAPPALSSAEGELDLELDLTKFRGPETGGLETPLATDTLPGATLGRVQPVRKLAQEPPAIPPKLQLRASF